MPADINTFDMLRPAVLKGMTFDQLRGELRRVLVMQARVKEYQRTIMDVLALKADEDDDERAT